MNLFEVKELRPYKIKSIETDNEKVRDFLFSLGFVPEEIVEVIIKQRHGIVALVKECRYSLDAELAKVILVYNDSNL
jgi:Fe2+ transport system protein FeoA